jgi:molybdopterin molybdotransferase
MGHRRVFRRVVTAVLAHEIKHRPGTRAEFVRVTLRQEAGGSLNAASTGMQGSGNLRSMAQADGLLIVPEASGNLSAGATVRVQMLDGGGFTESSGFMENAS